MKIEEALQLITNICTDFKGTLKDHQLIQQALRVIMENIKKQELVNDNQDVKEVIKTDKKE